MFSHDFFVASSSWNQMHKFSRESPSSTFLQEQIGMLTALLGQQECLTSATLNFLVEWLFLLINSFGTTGLDSVRERGELVPLRKAMIFLIFNGTLLTSRCCNEWDLDNILTPTRIDNIVDNLQVFETMNEFNEEQCATFIKLLCSSAKTKTLEGFHQIYKRIPPAFLMR